MDLDEGVEQPVLISLDKYCVMQLLKAKASGWLLLLALVLLILHVCALCAFTAHLADEFKHFLKVLLGEFKTHNDAFMDKVMLEHKFVAKRLNFKGLTHQGHKAYRPFQLRSFSSWAIAWIC